MKKTLIAAGIAAVVAAPAAFADVSVSGVVEQAFVNTDSATASSDEWTSSSDNSLTFKASEDLGNGLTAFASITLDVDNEKTATGATDATTYTHNTTKDQVVGLKGSFGTVVTGRMEDFTEGKLTSRMTLEGDGGAGGGAIEDGEGSTMAGRQNGAVAYVSPTMNGFHLGVAGFVLDNGTSTDKPDTFDATDIALFYDNGPLSVAASRETVDMGAYDKKTTVLTGSYSMGDLKATILRLSVDNAASNGDDRDDMMYRLDYKMGANSFTVAMNDNEKASGADGGDLWAVEAAHNFSKRTKIYGTWVDADTDKSGKDDTFTVGLKHKF